MKILAQLLRQVSGAQPSILSQKKRKLAETDRYLSSRRHSYHAIQPIGFKSRSDASYHLTAHSWH